MPRYTRTPVRDKKGETLTLSLSTKNKMAVFTVLLEVLGVLAVSQTTIDPDDGKPSLKIEAA